MHPKIEISSSMYLLLTKTFDKMFQTVREHKFQLKGKEREMEKEEKEIKTKCERDWAEQ